MLLIAGVVCCRYPIFHSVSREDIPYIVKELDLISDLEEQGLKKGKLRAHSDMMNCAVNDWALILFGLCRHYGRIPNLKIWLVSNCINITKENRMTYLNKMYGNKREDSSKQPTGKKILTE